MGFIKEYMCVCVCVCSVFASLGSKFSLQRTGWKNAICLEDSVSKVMSMLGMVCVCVCVCVFLSRVAVMQTSH